MNEKLWLLPQDKQKQQLANQARLKSTYVLAVIYIRTLKRDPKATVADFAAELSVVMSKLEQKHLTYVNAKRTSEDKFTRLRDLFNTYTEAKASSKLSKISKVMLRPSGLRVAEKGTYSMDLRFGSKERVIANDLAVTDQETELSVPEKPPFECEVGKRLDFFSVVLYDSQETMVSTGNSWLFASFAHSDAINTEDGLISTSTTTYYFCLLNFLILINQKQ